MKKTLSENIALFLGAFTCAVVAMASEDDLFVDYPEPGMQGESLASDKPGEVLARPYIMNMRVVGHSDVWRRDSNVQMAWVGDCAYLASTSPNFLTWGVTAEPATFGVAVIDVRNPASPVAIGPLRDRGSLYSAEAMAAADTPERKVLVAGTYEKGAGPEDERWLSIYDASDCVRPVLVAEYQWPETVHAITLAPNGKRVYATHIEPFHGKGGIHVLDIENMAEPEYLGKFGVTRADGSSFEFAPHDISVSEDETRIYAGVLGSQGGDLNHGIEQLPPNPVGLGPDAGGVYILDSSDIATGRPKPKIRQIGVAEHGGWHSVEPATIGGVRHLVGGGELGACPGSWPKIINLADETAPVLSGEFKLEMNYRENCPPPGPTARASMGISPDPGTATLHYNDVDSAADTRLGLFPFTWAGLRVADIRDPANPVELAYFKPGDACGGHVRYVAENGHIWMSCAKSGFYVLELSPDVRLRIREVTAQ